MLHDKRLSRSYSAVAEGELEIAAFALVVVLIRTRKCTDRCSILGSNPELPRFLDIGVRTVYLSIGIGIGKHDRIIGGTNRIACYVSVHVRAVEKRKGAHHRFRDTARAICADCLCKRDRKMVVPRSWQIKGPGTLKEDGKRCNKSHSLHTG